MTDKPTSFDKRPVNLQLWTIKFPVTAIASILHRMSGVFLFLAIPLVLWLWQVSLSDIQCFTTIKAWFNCFIVKLFVWAFFTALALHLVAGIRHLLMDCHIGDSKQSGRIGASSVLIITAIFAILLLIFLFCFF
jgi:succinate dehydrogenase / fumarate reductase cytochrome b subunit